MKIAVFSKNDSWHLSDLKRAAGSRHSLNDVNWETVSSMVPSDRGLPIDIRSNENSIAECDAVIVRAMPRGSLEQIVFRMDALAALERQGILVVNPPKAVETCVDKYLTLVRLKQACLPIPKTIVCQTAADASLAFDSFENDAVLKPIFGSEGRGIVRIREPDLARRTFRLLESVGQLIYLQEFVDHDGWDLRLLVLGEKVWAMRRENKLDWRSNASRGACVSAHQPTVDERDLAIRAANATGTIIAGVDVLYDRNGRPQIVEVNSASGWRHLSAVTGIDIAAELLAEMEFLCGTQISNRSTLQTQSE